MNPTRLDEIGNYVVKYRVLKTAYNGTWQNLFVRSRRVRIDEQHSHALEYRYRPTVGTGTVLAYRTTVGYLEKNYLWKQAVKKRKITKMMIFLRNSQGFFRFS
jgi:hypothetical protein